MANESPAALDSCRVFSNLFLPQHCLLPSSRRLRLPSFLSSSPLPPPLPSLSLPSPHLRSFALFPPTPKSGACPILRWHEVKVVTTKQTSATNTNLAMWLFLCCIEVASQRLPPPPPPPRKKNNNNKTKKNLTHFLPQYVS